MHSFKSTSYRTRKRFIERWLLNIIFSVVFFIGISYLDFYKNSLLMVVIIICIMTIIDFIRESNRQYINEIAIDTENRAIVFYCYQFWQGNKKIEQHFDELKFKIAKDWDSIFGKRSPVIFFFKDKPANFYVSTAKDKFAKETMIDLALLLEQLAKPMN